MRKYVIITTIKLVVNAEELPHKHFIGMDYEKELEARGLKKKALAELVGLSASNLAKVLKGDEGYDSLALVKRVQEAILKFPLLASMKEKTRRNTDPPIIIALTNNKGGTGKTTVSQNLAFGLCGLGFDVLMVDLDPQGHLTHVAGCEDVERHVGNLLTSSEKLSLDDVIVPLRNPNFPHHGALDILPADQRLESYNTLIVHEPDYQRILKTKLQDADYRFIILDCAPSLAAMTMNALTAAHHLIIPMQGENLPFLGLEKMLNAADRIREFANPDLSLLGVLRVRYNPSTKLGQSIVEKIMKYELPMLDTSIRQDVTLSECTAMSMSVFQYDASSRGAKDMRNLVLETLQKVGVAIPERPELQEENTYITPV